MAVPQRPLRSTTLLSGSSSFSHTPALQLALRKSLAGHWTLIDTATHKTRYYFSAQLDDSSSRQVRIDSPDGPLIAIISLETTRPTQCHVSFLDGKLDIDLKLSFRGRYRFAVDGRNLYWKRDVVCRESRTRRVFADTEGDTLRVYERAKPFLDVIVATFLAVKFKTRRHCITSNPCSWLSVAAPPYVMLIGLVVQIELGLYNV